MTELARTESLKPQQAQPNTGLPRSPIWASAQMKRGVCFGFCALGVAAQALSPEDVLSIQLGKLLIQPRLSVSETYNDNIFLRPSKPSPALPFEVEDDFVSTVSPGINLQLGRDEGSNVSLSFTDNSMLYALHPKQDASDQLVVFNGQYVGSKWVMSVFDRFEMLSSIYGNGSTLGAKLNRYIMRDVTTLSYHATEKTSLYARGQHNRVDFEKGVPLYDSDSLRGTLGASYQYGPKLSLLVEGYYGQSAATPNAVGLVKGPYSWVYGGFLGARGEFTPKLTGYLKLGFQDPGYGNGDPAPSSPVVEASVTHRFSDRTSLSLQYIRSSDISVEFSHYSYYYDELTLHVDQVIGQSGKLTASGNIDYGIYSYDRTSQLPGRDDSRLRLNATLSYQIKLWMVASLNYDHERFSSDLAGVITYDVNRVGIQLSMGF